MSVLYEGWNFIDGTKFDGKDDEVFIDLEFSLVVGQDVCKGKRTVQVDVSKLAQNRRPRRRILRIARRKLENYFDGHSDEHKNLFSECFEEETSSLLSIEQEDNLMRELLDIEDDYVNKSA